MNLQYLTTCRMIAFTYAMTGDVRLSFVAGAHDASWNRKPKGIDSPLI